jgi:hypothetical protein
MLTINIISPFLRYDKTGYDINSSVFVNVYVN